MAYCRQRGWDYSVSVTDPRRKAPLLRIVEALELAEEEWVELEADGEHCRLVPAWTVILVSRDDLPLPELVRRHRGKQGQENAFKGPLTDLGLHHPPCHGHAANQASYACGQIAQLLLRSLQYHLLPPAARAHGLRRIAGRDHRGHRYRFESVAPQVHEFLANFKSRCCADCKRRQRICYGNRLNRRSGPFCLTVRF